MKKSSLKFLAFHIFLTAVILCLVPFLAGAEPIHSVAFEPVEMLQQYAILPLTLVCLLIGWLLKHTIDALDNKWIPLILVVVGLLGVLWINNWSFTPQTFMSGLCSAALAVWIHNNYKNLTEKPPEQ